jgi:hypothetical protein
MNISITDIAQLCKKKVKNITLNINSPKDFGDALVTAVNIFHFPKMADARIEILLNFFCDETALKRHRLVAENIINNLKIGFDAEVIYNTIPIMPPTKSPSNNFYGTLIISKKL